MKKSYIKPVVRKFYKGEEIRTSYTRYGSPCGKHKPVDIKRVKKILQDNKDKRYRINSFNTRYSPDDLINIMKLLVEKKFISYDTSEDQFVYIFSDQIMWSFKKPIKWLSSKVALRYFLEEKMMPYTTIHKRQVANCFIDNKGIPIIISNPKKTDIIRKTIRKQLDDIFSNI